ncbi:MAG: hypothetical protein H0U64_04200 [Gemmatimonadaceae bacterium]|nr:hypothetical protein [Gemmatimonadaceae bacterium]
MPNPLNPRRLALDAARRLIFDGKDPEDALQRISGMGNPEEGSRLTPKAIERTRMSRTRSSILSNLETMYREAFDRARATEDPSQQATLDFAYRREQLYFEVLLDIRDALERR